MAITIQDKKSAVQDSKSLGQGRQNSGTIRHGGPLTATEVTDFKALLTEKFETYHDLTIEFTDLTDCDTLGVQLILSANRSAKARESRLDLKGDIEALQLAAERIGLNFGEYFDYISQTKADYLE